MSGLRIVNAANWLLVPFNRAIVYELSTNNDGRSAIRKVMVKLSEWDQPRDLTPITHDDDRR